MKSLIAVVFSLIAFSSLASEIPNVPVLMFHKVTEHEPPNRDNIHPSQFRKLMEMLKEQKFTTLTVDDVSKIYAGVPAPEKPIALTFDDGWASVTNAIEVMNEFNMKATFYIISSAFNDPQYLSYRAVSWISQQPRYQIGAHSHTHHMGYLTKNFISDDELIEEMKKSKQILDGIGIGNVTSYAWPFGVSSAKAVQAAIEHGFKSQVFVWKLEDLGRIQPQHFITRINIAGTCTPDRLKEILSSKKYEDCK